MPEFKFVQNPTNGKYVINAPKRAGRPDEAKSPTFCPFCPGENNEPELYNEGGIVRVLANKYPFAPIHEVIIHSSDHHRNFGELDLETSYLIFRTFRQRFQTHKDKGQVYIFHNRGIEGGESLIHPHSQLAVIPDEISLEIPALETIDQNSQEVIQNSNFYIFCPESSEWPDEVWLAPKTQNSTFGDASDDQIKDLSHIVTKLVQILELKFGKDFPYNFYIYPRDNWYLRFIPRIKKLGGFEVGTRVFVNTEDPKDTIDFLRKNFK